MIFAHESFEDVSITLFTSYMPCFRDLVEIISLRCWEGVYSAHRKLQFRSSVIMISWSVVISMALYLSCFASWFTELSRGLYAAFISKGLPFPNLDFYPDLLHWTCFRCLQALGLWFFQWLKDSCSKLFFYLFSVSVLPLATSVFCNSRSLWVNTFR